MQICQSEHIFIYSYLVCGFCVWTGGRFLVPESEYYIKGHACDTMQCHLIKKRCLEIICTGCASKSKVSSMKTARSRLNSHAMDA